MLCTGRRSRTQKSQKVELKYTLPRNNNNLSLKIET